MVMYNNNGYGSVIYDESVLTPEELANSFHIDEEPDFTQGIVRTDGKTWWYEDFPEPTEPIEPTPPQPTLEERVTELEEQNEMISDVLDALLMGDLEV